MHREHHRWFSPSLNRDMDLLVFGHAGARGIVFPTSKGKFYEWEDRKMMDVLREPLENGWLQLYCLDSVDEESWYAWWKHPAERALRQVQYEQYLLSEVLPLSQQLNDNPFLMTMGASFGAYHAVNIALRHPNIFNRAIGMSGIYDISRWTDGFHDDNIYYNNPVEFIANEADNGRLHALRQLDIILAVGREDSLRENNERLSTALWNKDIGNALRVWEGWSHDWPYWEKMISLYINGSD